MFPDSSTRTRIWCGPASDVREFVARLAGEHYDGGGINTTVDATRAATADELFGLAADRGRRMISNGTTTVEIKTGYGLTPTDELKSLDVIGRLAAELPWSVESTYLGAHVVPRGRDRTEYVDEVVATIPAAAAADATWVDVFCDEGVFSIGETRKILQAAKDAGLWNSAARRGDRPYRSGRARCRDGLRQRRSP